MANSANPEINKKIATSALGTLVIATVFFYLGDRYAETLVTYPGQIFDHLSDAFLSMWQTIKDAPFALDMTSNSLLFGGACFLIIWMIWLRYVAFIGNYRSGEESGSARWGTVKEGKKFKDLQTEDNNLLFTKNFGLALHRPKFDPEYDRNLNVLVVGGSGSGKTFNYVTPNICQLNTSYFVTDPKGTLLKDAGYLFTDNGYKLKSFNTINLDESMHYNPLKYVKTDTDILSFVNCFIMNTNPEGKSSGDPFWENAEKMLYTALIALLRDWFPAKDYNMSSLLTLLSLAEARENDENFKSALDLMFLQIEEGKKYKQNDGSSPDAAGNAGLSRSFGTKQADNGWSWVPSKFKRNSDGVKPADCGGLSADEDFALMNYKNFKVAAGKTLKSILISCNVRLAPIATDGVQRCTELAFQKAAERGDNLPPTLQDFYDAANEQPEEQAQVIALRYERFVKGSMNFFNHQSNVDFNTRIVDFNLKDLPDSMLVFALINVCEAVRNRMYFNAKRNVRTWLYVEEMQSMFAYPTVLNYFSRFSNEGRKFGLLLTGISQNATAMLANEAARNIVLNADFLMLLKQSPLDRMKWAELLNLSEQEEECIDESAEPGDGLLIAGNARVPIRGKFPSGNVLYDLFSTNPNETKKTGLGDKKDAKPVI